MKAPLLVQMAGHGGAGKSTLARQVAARLGGVTIDLDVIKTALLDAGLDWDEASRASYETIYALADDLIAAGTPCVVVDTPSYWATIHERLTATADAHRARYVFVECVASEAARAERLASRPSRRSQIRVFGDAPADAPAATPPIHARPIVRPPTGTCLSVDTGGPVDLDDVSARIDAVAGGTPSPMPDRPTPDDG